MSPLEKMARAYEGSIAPMVATGPGRDLDNPFTLGICRSAMIAALKTLSEDEVKACMAMVRAD